MMFCVFLVVVEASADLSVNGGNGDIAHHITFLQSSLNDPELSHTTGSPSSLLDSNAPQLSPDDYARMTLREMGFRGNINDKLKELEEKANQFLEKSIEGGKIVAFEKLQTDPSLSSSFIEKGVPHQKHMLQAFEDKLEKRGKLAEERTHKAIETLLAKTHELDKTTKEDETEARRIEAEMKKEAAGAESTLSLTRNSLLETTPDSIDTQIKKMSVAKRRDVGQSSFLQDNPYDSQEPDLEYEDSKMQELLADIQNTDKQFDAGPGSFLERGYPENEAQKQLDAAGPRLKELDQHFKHEIGQYADDLQQDEDSSLLQTEREGAVEPSGFMMRLKALMQEHKENSQKEPIEAVSSDGVHAPTDAPATDLAKDANFGAAPVAPEPLQPSWLQAAPTDSTGSVNLRKA